MFLLRKIIIIFSKWRPKPIIRRVGKESPSWNLEAYPNSKLVPRRKSPRNVRKHPDPQGRILLP